MFEKKSMKRFSQRSAAVCLNRQDWNDFFNGAQTQTVFTVIEIKL